MTATSRPFAAGDRVATYPDENVQAHPGVVLAIQPTGPFAGQVWVVFDTDETEAHLYHPADLFHDSGIWP